MKNMGADGLQRDSLDGRFLYCEGNLRLSRAAADDEPRDTHLQQPAPTAYYPYGQERTSTPDGVDKFGTYFRDAPGQDYADQRYYNANVGAFWSPDPGGLVSVNSKNPTSWNRYAYVDDDPINFNDRNGLFVRSVDDGWGGDGGGGAGGGGIGVPFCDLFPNYLTCNGGIDTDGTNGGGGGGGGGVFNPMTIPGFGQALGVALAALATPDCASLFGLSANSMNPGDLLAHAVAAAADGAASLLEFGTTSKDGIIAHAAEAGTTVVTSDPWAYINGDGQGVESSRVVIEINLQSWSGLTQIQQAQVIIHELGHTFDELIGAGGSQFVNDAMPNGDPNPAAEDQNAALVQKCIHN